MITFTTYKRQTAEIERRCAAINAQAKQDVAALAASHNIDVDQDVDEQTAPSEARTSYANGCLQIAVAAQRDMQAVVIEVQRQPTYEDTFYWLAMALLMAIILGGIFYGSAELYHLHQVSSGSSALSIPLVALL